MKKEKVLIVDDEKNIVTLIQLHLDTEGYETIVAYNGETALKRIVDEIPDLIILDVMMPRMDGLEVCRRIKANKELATIPVIMLTAKTRKEDLKRGWEAGVTDYITKPFSAQRLVEVVKKALKSRKTAQLKEKKEILPSIPTNIAVVGTSHAGISIIQFLLGDNNIIIKGVADSDINSSCMVLAQKLNIFSTTDVRELLNIKDLHFVFMLSSDTELLTLIEQEKPGAVEIIRGDTASLIWYLIEQSSELQEKQRSLVKELNTRVNDLQILYEGSTLMGSAIHVNSVLKATIEAMRKAVNADSGLVMLLDEETDEWSVQANFNFPVDLLKEREPLNLGQGIARLAIKKKQPMTIKDVANEKGRFILSNISDIASTIVVPLFIKNKAFGVAYLNHSFRKEYSQGEIYLLSVLASQSSVALDNARLYETVKQKHQAVEQLLEKLIHSSELSSSQSMNEAQSRIGYSINETINELETLHDNLNSELTHVKTRIDEMKKLTSESLSKMHKISEITISGDQEKIDLLPSLEIYLQRFEAETGIVTELMVSGIKKKLAESIETTIYRIIQEALKNVKEHSGASNVRVRVKILSDQFNVAIEDDGVGFDYAKASVNGRKITGINSMKEKASFLGGTFKIRSQAGRGTTVLLRIPVPLISDQ